MSATDWSALALTPVEEDDLRLISVWQNSPSLHDVTMGHRLPVPFENVREWFDAIRQDRAQSRVLMAIRVHAKIVGTIELHSISWLHRNAHLAVSIGETRERGKGIGRGACSLLLDYAFNSLGMHRVELQVVHSNVSAITLYRSLGFRVEGTRTEAYFVNGGRADVLVLGLLHNEWQWNPPHDAHRLIGGPDPVSNTT